MDTRERLRVAFAVLILSSVLFLGITNASSATEPPYSEFAEQSSLPADQREPVAPPREGITVVTSHLAGGDIVALAPDGTVLYHDDTHDGYWDVDPSPRGDETVVYAATDEITNASVCRPTGPEGHCIRQTIERANLTTGETTVLYSQVAPRYDSSEWHDVDRVGPSRYLVADMYADEAFIVNVSTGIVEWEWSAQNHLPLSSGGPFPDDWVHLNDVEVLPDGRIMLSLRNQDQVVFVDPGTGVDDSWTLGDEDRHAVLHEQHNPDYIPASNGGPAVLVADSENNCVVEYQRTRAGDWRRTWVWQDRRLQWGRDADRLPNGHTLVTDTQGGRVVELDERGNVTWQVDVPIAYEAERLNTGAESSGGPSAASIDLPSRTAATASEEARSDSAEAGLRAFIKGLFPTKFRNAVANATPPWTSLWDLLVATFALVTALVWVAAELRWSGVTLRTPVVRE